jgi:hypothetical protein
MKAFAAGFSVGLLKEAAKLQQLLRKALTWGGAFGSVGKMTPPPGFKPLPKSAVGWPKEITWEKMVPHLKRTMPEDWKK